MPSAGNTRHRLGTYEETRDKSFKFVDKSIPQADIATTVSSLCLSKPSQSNSKSIDRQLLELFGSHDACMMEIDKSTWHESVMSWTKYKRVHKGSFDDYEMYKFIYHPYAKYRRKGVPRLAEWQRHRNSDLTIIIRPPARQTRWIAFDIDVKTSEQELIHALKQVEKNTGLSFTYCPSTSGRGWHVWLFTAQSKAVKLMSKLARKIVRLINIEIDQLYPQSNQQISAPFAEHRPLKTTTDRTITNPANLPFNDAALNSLRFQHTNTPKESSKPSERKPQTQKTAPKKKVKQSLGNWLDDVPASTREALANCKTIDEHQTKVAELYPLSSGYRQALWLMVTHDWKEYGMSKDAALKLLTRIAKAKSDTQELNRRKKAFKDSWSKSNTIGSKPKSYSKTFRKPKPCFYSNLNKISKDKRSEYATKRLVTALWENRLDDNGTLGMFSDRYMMLASGMSKTSITNYKRELRKLGILKGNRKNLRIDHELAKAHLTEVETEPTEEQLSKYQKLEKKITEKSNEWKKKQESYI